MKHYRAVRQRSNWGCGVACVASRLGLSYRQAKKLLEEAKGGGIDDVTKRSLEGLNLDPIAIVLREKGIKVVADWSVKKYPIGTIVLAYGKKPYDDGHYLLRTPKGWMDPWANMSQENPIPRRVEIRPQLSPKGYKLAASVALIEQG